MGSAAYQSMSGQTSCLTCPASSFRPSGSRTTCATKAVCAAGTRQKSAGDDTHDRTCESCQASKGEYTALLNQVTCSTCADGTYSIGTGCIDCPPGYQCVSGVREDCTGGTYADIPRQSRCKACLHGQYQPGAKATYCVACGVGKAGDDVRARTSESEQCHACAAGKFQAGVGKSSCTVCPSGQYQNAMGQVSCVKHRSCVAGENVRLDPTNISDRTCSQCTIGRYSSSTNAANCTVCPKGKYQDSTGQPYCAASQLCEPGTFDADPTRSDMARCRVCGPGQHSNVSNAIRCSPCQPKSYQPLSRQTYCLQHTQCAAGEHEVFVPNATVDRACEQCGPGQFADGGVCLRCPRGKFQRHSGKAYCDTCTEGQVCDTPDADGLMVAPRSCPVGMQCSTDNVTAACRDEGKKQDPATGKCISCDDDEFTDLEANGCIKCPLGADGSVLEGVECTQGMIRVEPDFFVVPGQLGPQLQVLRCLEYGVCHTCGKACMNMTVRTTCLGNTTGTLCAQCMPDFGKAAGYCVRCPGSETQGLIILVFVAMALVLALLMTKKSLQDHLDTETATVSVLRIGLNFLMMTSFLAGLQLDWGSMLQLLFNTAKASSGGLPPLLQCSGVTFALEMTFSLLLPLAVPCVPLLVLTLWSVVLCAGRRNPSVELIWGVSRQRFFINSCVAVAYLVWPVLVFQALRIIDCSVEIDGARFVATDVSVKCHEGVHRRLWWAAILELALVVPILPVLLFYRLRFRKCGTGTYNRLHYYFLYGGFREGYEYWESVVLARKFLVLAATVFLARNAYGLQVAAATWIMCGATALQVLCKPYQNKTEEILESTSLFVITLCCMLGQLMLMAGEQGLGAAGMQACRVIVGVLVTGTALLFVAYFIREIAFTVKRKHDRSNSSARAVALGAVPPLETHTNNPIHQAVRGWSVFRKRESNTPVFSQDNPLRTQQQAHRQGSRAGSEDGGDGNQRAK